MTREQQKKFRELKKCCAQMLGKSAKAYGFKKKDCMIWSAKGELYFSLMVDVREKDGRCWCAAWERIKPLWMDELFWDIIDMPENKSEPLSLRCIGAFAISGMTFFEDRRELPEWRAEELEKCIAEYLEHFRDTVNDSDMESWNSVFDERAYQGEVQAILLLIHRQEYREALERVQSMEERSYFQNKGIWFKEYAEAYCRRHISPGD
ncbi:MAG: hypothetical protein NC337_03475 [Roseburia sp.]|nr:hypothetical protein [Roseburia sp.]